MLGMLVTPESVVLGIVVISLLALTLWNYARYRLLLWKAPSTPAKHGGMVRFARNAGLSVNIFLSQVFMNFPTALGYVLRCFLYALIGTVIMVTLIGGALWWASENGYLA